jgi:hypothetical protein
MPFPKPCIGAGGPCPTKALTRHSSGRCEHCRRRHWNTRGTTIQRGYGPEHQRLRQQWAPIVEAGGVLCWRCQNPINPGDDWDLGHDDLDRSVYRGPEHRAHNRATKNCRASRMVTPSDS